MTSGPRIRSTIVALSVFVLVGCNQQEPAAGAVHAPSVEWQKCGEIECATLDVPIDRGSPAFASSPTIALRAYADRSSVKGSRHLPLFLHPGGPGADVRSAVLGARTALAPIIDDFDIYALSTRGTIDGEHFSCGDVLDELKDVDIDPEAAKKVARGCNTTSPELVGNIGTRDSAEDLEQFRIALGFASVRYLGWSYGATLGAAWMMTHPDSLRAAVFDAPVDPRASWAGLLAAKSRRGSEEYRHMLSEIGLSEPKLSKMTSREIALAREYVLYDGGSSLLSESIKGGEAKFRELVDLRLGVTPEGVDDGGIETQVGVHCSDVSHEEARRAIAVTEATPTVGLGATFDRICLELPGTLRPLSSIPVDKHAVQSDAMVISTMGDHVVPYENSIALAKLMRWRHFEVDGHRHLAVGFDPVATKKAMAFLASGD